MTSSRAHGMRITGPTWAGPDYGEAIGRAVRARASVIVEKAHQGSPVLDFNAWWRGGDDANARVYLEKGAVTDIKTGSTWKAGDFAREALGMSLPEMMKQYGPGSAAQEPRTAPIAKPPKQPPSVDLDALWEALIERQRVDPWDEQDGEGAAGAASRWLIEERGFPANIGALAESGFGLLDAELVRGLRGAVGRVWLDRHIDAALVMPIRSAATNRVEGLDLRAFAPVDGEKRRGPGAHVDEDGSPRGYGFAGACLQAELLVLCEGAADTMAAESIVRADPRIVAVGAHDAAAFGRWATWLIGRAFRGTLVVVRHLDGQTHGAGEERARAAVQTLCSARLGSASLFGWGAFARSMQSVGLDLRPHIKSGFDLADVVKLSSRAGVAWGSLVTAFTNTLEAQRAR
jgi:hypothetical protein